MDTNFLFSIFILVPIVFSQNAFNETNNPKPLTKIQTREPSEPTKITLRESLETSKVGFRESIEILVKTTPEPIDSELVEPAETGPEVLVDPVPNKVELSEEDLRAQLISEEHGSFPSNSNNPASTCTVSYDVKIFKLRGAMWENDHLYWTDHRIPYQISGNFSKNLRTMVVRAIKKFENSSCLKFPPRTKDDTHFLTIFHGDACRVKKRTRNESRAIMMNEKCITEHNIQHNIMHILGFSHEHTRPDRDKYVEINWNNIAPDRKRFFSITPNSFVGEPYDYESIMHVAENYQATNPDQPTVTPKKEGVKIGKGKKLSPGDSAKIKKLFKCS